MKHFFKKKHPPASYHAENLPLTLVPISKRIGSRVTTSVAKRTEHKYLIPKVRDGIVDEKNNMFLRCLMD